MENKIYIIRL